MAAERVEAVEHKPAAEPLGREAKGMSGTAKVVVSVIFLFVVFIVASAVMYSRKGVSKNE